MRCGLNFSISFAQLGRVDFGATTRKGPQISRFCDRSVLDKKEKQRRKGLGEGEEENLNEMSDKGDGLDSLSQTHFVSKDSIYPYNPQETRDMTKTARKHLVRKD